MMYQTAALVKTVVPKQTNRAILEQGYQKKKAIRVPQSLDPGDHEWKTIAKFGTLNITGKPVGCDNRY